MESLLQPLPHGRRRDEEDPHSAALHSVDEGEGEHNHHGEKKSVLKKVKDKAKKIKHTIMKHGHEHEHEHPHDQISEDEDEHEEFENDPEVHGAPNVVNRPSHPAMVGEMGWHPAEITQSESRKPFQVTPTATQTEEANVTVLKIGPVGGLEKDPHSPNNNRQGIRPSNYQTKVVDPTGGGGEEVDVAPLVRRFDEMEVGHGSELKPVLESQLHTGSHDQFNHQSKLKAVLEPQLHTGSHDQFGDELNVKRGSQLHAGSRDQFGHESKLKPVPESQLDTGNLDEFGHDLKPKHRPESQLYTGSHDQFAPGGIPPQELFKPESKPADRSPKTASERSKPDQPDTMPVDTTVGKVSSAAHMIADKAATAKNLVASKLGYGDQRNQSRLDSATEHGHEDVIPEGTDKGVSVKEYLAGKLRPGDEDKALSEAITDAFHKKVEGTQGTKEVPLTGRVTESEEVAARLGTGKENKREGEDATAAGSESSGTGVAGRLKDAVGVWLGKSTGTETAKNSVGQSYVSDVGSAASGGDANNHQRRLQESGN